MDIDLDIYDDISLEEAVWGGPGSGQCTISDAGGDWEVEGTWVEEGFFPNEKVPVVATATSGPLDITGSVVCAGLDLSLYQNVLLNSSVLDICGSLIFSPFMYYDIVSSGDIYITTSTNYTSEITTAGALLYNLYIYGSGTATLQDALHTSYWLRIADQSTFDANDKDVDCHYCWLLDTATLLMGSGTWYLVELDVEDECTLTCETSNTYFICGQNDDGWTGYLYFLQDIILYNVTILSGESGNMWFDDASNGFSVTFNTLSVTDLPMELIGYGAPTLVISSSLILRGLNADNLLSIYPDTGTLTVSKAGGTVICDFLNLTAFVATGGATFIARSSIDNEGNTGWAFSGTADSNILVSDALLSEEVAELADGPWAREYIAIGENAELRVDPLFIEVGDDVVTDSWFGVGPETGVCTLSDAGGDWSDASTWVEGYVPNAGIAVVVTPTSGDLTLTEAAECKSLDMTGYTGYFLGNGYGIGIHGSLTLPENSDTFYWWGFDAAVLLYGSGMINTHGFLFYNSLSIELGASYTLAADLRTGADLDIYGSLFAANYNILASNITFNEDSEVHMGSGVWIVWSELSIATAGLYCDTSTIYMLRKVEDSYVYADNVALYNVEIAPESGTQVFFEPYNSSDESITWAFNDLTLYAPTDLTVYDSSPSITLQASTFSLDQSLAMREVTDITGNNNWRTAAMSDDGLTILAGINNGDLYISRDGGTTWSVVRPAGEVTKQWRDADISADGQVIVVVARSDRVYKSSDNGVNWSDLQPTGDENRSWQSCAIDSDGSVIIVGEMLESATGRLYMSTNGGTSFTEVRPSGEDVDTGWRSVACDSDGSHLIAMEMDTSWDTEGRVWASVNGGSTWTECFPETWEPPAGEDAYYWWQHCAIDADGSVMYVASYDGWLYKSTDYGVNWSRIVGVSDEGYPVELMFIKCSSNGSVVLVGGYEVSALSTDGGSTWKYLHIRYSKTVGCGAISADGSEFIMAEGAWGTGKLWIYPTSYAESTIKGSNESSDQWSLSQATGSVALYGVTISQCNATGGAYFSAIESYDNGYNTGIEFWPWLQDVYEDILVEEDLQAWPDLWFVDVSDSATIEDWAICGELYGLDEAFIEENVEVSLDVLNINRYDSIAISEFRNIGRTPLNVSVSDYVRTYSYSPGIYEAVDIAICFAINVWDTLTVWDNTQSMYSSLVSYWKLNETGGDGTAHDEMGYSDGAYNQWPLYHQGYGLSDDIAMHGALSTSAYTVRFYDTAYDLLNFSIEFMYQMWFPTLAYTRVAYKNNGSYGWQIQHGGILNEIYCRVDTSSGSNQTCGTIVVGGAAGERRARHHIVYTFEYVSSSVGYVKAYKDGVLQDSGTIQPGANTYATDAVMFFYVYSDQIVDNIRFWSKTLSADEVRILSSGSVDAPNLTTATGLTVGHAADVYDDLVIAEDISSLLDVLVPSIFDSLSITEVPTVNEPLYLKGIENFANYDGTSLTGLTQYIEGTGLIELGTYGGKSCIKLSGGTTADSAAAIYGSVGSATEVLVRFGFLVTADAVDDYSANFYFVGPYKAPDGSNYGWYATVIQDVFIIPITPSMFGYFAVSRDTWYDVVVKAHYEGAVTKIYLAVNGNEWLADYPTSLDPFYVDSLVGMRMDYEAGGAPSSVLYLDYIKVDVPTIAYDSIGIEDGWAVLSGLISYYRFEDNAATTTVLDTIGANHLTATTNTTNVSELGLLNKCFDLNGTSEWATISGAFLNGLSAFTVAVWVKADAIGSDKGWLVGTSPTSSDAVMAMRFDASGVSGGGTNLMKFAVTVGVGDTYAYESASNIQTTNWTFVVMSWASGSVLDVYINGVLDVPTWRQGGTPTGVTSGATTLNVGRGAKDTGGAVGWDGKLDNLQIWNRKLTQGEILFLYNDGNGRENYTSPEIVLTTLNTSVIENAIATTDYSAQYLTVLNTSLSDDILASEDLSLNLTVLVPNVADDISIAESVSVLDLVVEVGPAVDTIAITESVSVYLTVLNFSIADDVVSDEYLSLFLDVLVPSIFDDVVVADVLFNLYLDVLNYSIFDDVVIAENLSNYLDVLNTSIADTILLTDVLDLYLDVLYTSVADSAVLEDYISLFVNPLNVSVLDTFIVSDWAEYANTYYYANLMDYEIEEYLQIEFNVDDSDSKDHN